MRVQQPNTSENGTPHQQTRKPSVLIDNRVSVSAKLQRQTLADQSKQGLQLKETQARMTESTRTLQMQAWSKTKGNGSLAAQRKGAPQDQLRENSPVFQANALIQRVIANEVYNAPGFASADIQAPLAPGAAPAAVHPPGWCLDHEPINNPNDHGQTKPHHHERGHLIGRQFGGIGGLANLMTLTQGSNGNTMQIEEETIADIVENNPANIYTYTVTPNYNAGYADAHVGNVDPTMAGHVYSRHPAPESVNMHLQIAGGGAVAHNATIDNGNMYPQHQY